MNKVLLMTSCIFPYSNVPVLKLKEKDERLNHYYLALEKYIKYSDFNKIVFCDNSLYKEFNVDKYKKMANSMWGGKERI